MKKAVSGLASSPGRSEARRRQAGSPHLSCAVAGFALSLFIPSTAIIQRYLGLIGVAAYLFVASAILLLFVRHRHALAERASRVATRQVLWLAVLTLLVLLVAFALIYPVADSGVIGGGSDTDDALDSATTELLHGRYPYYTRTYLGNPTSQLPGAMILAVPFVLLGNSAYQSFFWLVLLFASMKWYFRDIRTALLLMWAVFALSPIVLYHIMVGSDYVANSLYVLLAVLWLAWAVPQPGLASWKKALLAVFLGVALSSRANYLVVLPILYATLARHAGWKSAAGYAAITVSVFLLVTVPFYLVDPQGFSPLHAAGKLGQFESVMPFAGLVIPLATGILALVLAWLQPAGRGLDRMLRDCAIALAFPVLSGLVLFSVRQGRVNLTFAAFGVFFLFFGAVAFWGRFCEHTELSVSRMGPAGAPAGPLVGRAERGNVSTGSRELT